MMFSIIIPTYHRNDLLAKCLACLSPGIQTLNASLYEVIITDDGKESTAEELIQTQFPWARWVKGPQRGPAANRNNGANQAQGQWLIFTDDDCLPGIDILEQYYLAVQSHSDYCVFEGKTIADRSQTRYDEESPVNEAGGNLWSCNFAILKSLFHDLNGFDERFPYAAMEDVDFNIRLRNYGVKTLFIENALVVHPYRLIKNNKYIHAYHSFDYFLNKHNLINTQYRIFRFKHLIYSLFTKGKLLLRLKCKGVASYYREHLFYAKLIILKKRFI